MNTWYQHSMEKMSFKFFTRAKIEFNFSLWNDNIARITLSENFPSIECEVNKEKNWLNFNWKIKHAEGTNTFRMKEKNKIHYV